MKGAVAGAMALVLGLMWNERDFVIAPYTEERDELEFTLDGLDLTIDPTEVGPSPYGLPVASDTRTVVLPVSFPAPPLRPESAEMNGGTAALAGVVDFAGTPIEGATVRVDRAVLGDSSSADLLTDADGNWSITGLRGGRYRVRAFVPGEYASDGSTVLFVDEGSTHQLGSPVIAPGEGVGLRFFGPDEIVLGSAATIAVTAVAEAVDVDGRLVMSPVVTPQLAASVTGPSRLLSADVVASDDTGTARFLIRCDNVGRGLLTIETVGAESTSLILPPCVPAPPPPEPTEEPLDE